MKKLTVIAAVLLFCSQISWSDETTCPAHRAGEVGYNPFTAFHEIMAPTWHTAWPSKDYSTMFASGPKFAAAFDSIAAMNPTFKHASKGDAFNKNREAFALLVKEYNQACAASDSTKVYALMPQLHDSFEMTASCLLPISFPEFDSFIITLNLILESHLPNNNMEGIIGSTETLLQKAESLLTVTLPAELAAKKDEISLQIQEIKHVAGLMKESCDNNDLKTYQEQSAGLSKLVNDFVAKYI